MSMTPRVLVNDWAELVEKLRARFTVLAMRSDAITLRWRSARGGQSVFIHHARVLENGCLIMAVEMGPEDRLDVHAALAEALRLPVGALVRRDDMLALRHVMRGGPWDVALVVEAVELMARGAQLLMEKMTARRRPENLAMFANYAA